MQWYVGMFKLENIVLWLQSCKWNNSLLLTIKYEPSFRRAWPKLVRRVEPCTTRARAEFSKKLVWGRQAFDYFSKSSYEKYELCVIYILWRLVNDIILLKIISLPYFSHLSLDRQNKALLPHLSFLKRSQKLVFLKRAFFKLVWFQRTSKKAR
jgi:hypothetical protein